MDTEVFNKLGKMEANIAHLKENSDSVRETLTSHARRLSEMEQFKTQVMMVAGAGSAIGTVLVQFLFKLVLK